MLHFDPAKRGREVPTNALYGKMYEYYDQGPDQSPCLVKCIVVKDKSKLGQYIQTFTVGFTNSHPSIFRFKGFAVQEELEGTVFYIFMKAMKRNLGKYIQEERQRLGDQGHLPLERIVLVFYQLTSAFAYLKDNDIVHSNIGHDSVLLEDDDSIKLTGFINSKLEFLITGKKGRTLSYWPPERFAEKPKESNEEACNEEELKKRAKDLALKTDIWCLGKLIVDLCLLQDKIVKQTTYFQINKKVREDLTQVEKIYGKPLADILRLLLDSEPEKRIDFHTICDKLNEEYFFLVRKLPHTILRGSIIEEHMKTLSLSCISNRGDDDHLDEDLHQAEQSHLASKVVFIKQKETRRGEAVAAGGNGDSDDEDWEEKKEDQIEEEEQKLEKEKSSHENTRSTSEQNSTNQTALSTAVTVNEIRTFLQRSYDGLK